MIELIKGLALTNYFIESILLIILIGILTMEFFDRKKDNRKGILGFLILSIGITIFIIIDTYRFFTGISKGILLTGLIIWTIFLLSIFIINCVRVWNKINKKLFWGVPIFVIGILLFEVLPKFFVDLSIEILNIITTAGAMILLYFLIIKFLVGTSLEKK